MASPVLLLDGSNMQICRVPTCHRFEDHQSGLTQLQLLRTGVGQRQGSAADVAESRSTFLSALSKTIISAD